MRMKTENDFHMTIVMIRMNYIKINDIRSVLGIPNKVTDIIKKKRLKWFGHMITKTMPVMSTIHTRITLPTDNSEDDHQSDR